VLLTVSVGLPYFVLASTSPLLQSWYGRSRSGVYRLYAVSNLGSMAALLGYPLWIEPRWGTGLQLQSWSVGYACFAVLCGGAAWAQSRGRGAEIARGETDSSDTPGFRLQFTWLALPACASLLLVTLTAHITQNIAPIPLLWVLPLALYLLSFVVCFEREVWYSPRAFGSLAMVALGVGGYALLAEGASPNLKVMIPLYLAVLFVLCMFCHGELARRKPAPARLTEFYLLVSLGGALGSVLAALVAPRLFTGRYELPLAMVACAALAWALALRESWISGPLWAAMALALGGVTLIQVVQAAKARASLRNFYGTLTVHDFASGENAVRFLFHGSIIHGAQFQSESRRGEPTMYFGRESGAGLLLASMKGPRRIGIIGLGAGTLAAYGRRGDSYRFYELNPQVIEVARRDFRFLSDTAAGVEVIAGDGRLALEREAPQQFDVLAVDAFSGDSIPIHLLTREAFQLYLRHLKPDGVLAMHLTNTYLDLPPLAGRVAASVGLEAYLVESLATERTRLATASWMLAGRGRGWLESPELRQAARPLPPRRDLPVWTDDYSNVFRILK